MWTSHVHVESDSALGSFWSLIAELAWRDYFDDPRMTSFGVDEFDRFPKGTTCSLGRCDLLLEAFDRSASGTPDQRNANDDTPVLRYLAAQEDIHVSPHFACRYSPRESLDRSSGTRFTGASFLDGHGKQTPATSRRGRLLPGERCPRRYGAAAASGAPGCGCGLRTRRRGAWRQGRPISSRFVRFALVTPVYAVGHAVGMWKGLGLLLARRLGFSQ